ncbi:MAG: hypothetical protein GYA21_19595 [Myxococcales bacterium]|nr:hypothetical protein [Myxococcales bacterium]
MTARLLCLLPLVLLTACPKDEACEVDTDCDGTLICVDGRCVPRGCGEGCPAGWFCDGDRCLRCDQANHCGADCRDCTLGLTNRACVAGVCGCTSEAECQRGEVCLTNACQACVPDCSGRCGGADDGCGGSCTSCPSGEWCDAERCRACDSAAHCGPACLDCQVQGNNRACVNAACGCLSDTDCLSGEVCADARCTGCQPDCQGRCGGADDGCGGICTSCPGGEWCDAEMCRACDSASHCGPACLNCRGSEAGQACIAGVCGCASDGDCEREQACDLGRARCVARVSVEADGNCLRVANDRVFARACPDGRLEVGRIGGVPWVMDRDAEDHDIVCILQAGESRCDNLGPWRTIAPADARSILQNPLWEGNRGCARTVFSRLPVEATPGTLADTNIDLTWEVCLEPGADEVRVRLSVNDGEYYGLDLDRLYFPYAPRLSVPGSGYAVLPLWHGLLLPVGWVVPTRIWSYVEDGRAVFHTEWEGASAGWGMPWFGAVESDGRALLVVVHGEADASLRVHQVTGEAPRVTPTFRAALDLFRDGGRRELSYVPFDRGDHATLALRYREFARAAGRFRSLSEKRAAKPSLEKMLGGVFFPASTCYYDVHHPCPRPDDPAQCPCGRMYCGDSFLEVAAKTVAIASAAEEPIVRGVVHVDGWGQRGYDNLHPDVIYPLSPCRPAPDGSPDCGPCAQAGGTADFVTMAEALGRTPPVQDFLLELHDNYRDFYLDAPSYAGGTDAIKQWDGSLPPVIDFWAGGPQQILCASRALPYLIRNYDALGALGVVPGGVYLDVFTAVSADQCFDAVHRMRRPESLAFRAQMFAELSRRGLLTASEQMADWAVPHLDHIYWSNYLRTYDPEAADGRYRWADSVYGTPVGIPAPLLELSYHDAILVPWPVLEGEARETALHAWLAAGVPMIGLDTAAADPLARRTANRQARLHQAVATEAMTAHRFLDDRFMREEADFSGGVRTRTDRDTWTLEAENFPAGTPQPADLRYRVSARVVSFEPLPPDAARLTLEWRSLEPRGTLPAGLQVFLHGVDAGGVIVSNADHGPPSSPATWETGQAILDGPHLMTFSQGGTFEVIAGLFDPDPPWPRLPIVTERADHALRLGALTIEGGDGMRFEDRTRAEPRLVLLRQTGDLSFETMTEWWLERPVPAGRRIFLHLVDENDAIVVNADYDPAIPFERWPLLARRRELRRVLSLPAGAVPGTYRLVTGIFDPNAPGYPREDLLGADAQRRFVLARIRVDGVPGRIQRLSVCPATVPGCPDFH